MTQEDWTKMNKESHYNSLIKQDLANRKLIRKLQLERDELKKQLKLYDVVKCPKCNNRNVDPKDGEVRNRCRDCQIFF